MDQDTLFKSVDLDAGDQQRLRDFHDKEMALKNLVQMQQERGEARAQELIAQAREFWQGIATKYKLDMQHINYAPNENFTRLDPILVKLK